MRGPQAPADLPLLVRHGFAAPYQEEEAWRSVAPLNLLVAETAASDNVEPGAYPGNQVIRLLFWEGYALPAPPSRVVTQV